MFGHPNSTSVLKKEMESLKSNMINDKQKSAHEIIKTIIQEKISATVKLELLTCLISKTPKIKIKQPNRFIVDSIYFKNEKINANDQFIIAFTKLCSIIIDADKTTAKSIYNLL